jgi:hypothetical protein
MLRIIGRRFDLRFSLTFSVSSLRGRDAETPPTDDPSDVLKAHPPAEACMPDCFANGRQLASDKQAGCRRSFVKRNPIGRTSPTPSFPNLSGCVRSLAVVMGPSCGGTDPEGCKEVCLAIMWAFEKRRCGAKRRGYARPRRRRDHTLIPTKPNPARISAEGSGAAFVTITVTVVFAE